MYKRIVVKVGSQLIASKKDALREIIAQVAQLSNAGAEVIIVSSGAIASALKMLRLKKRPDSLAELQALAAIGQVDLMHSFKTKFARHKKRCAQILLTRDDFDERKRYINAKNTFAKLLQRGIVPIVNENDTVSIDEIKFGDNDILSALVAMLVQADVLIILSTVDGLHKVDAKTKELKELISEVTRIDAGVHQHICNIEHDYCVGGMSSKVEAVRIATQVGIKSVLANGTRKNVILDIAAGRNPGTEFKEKSKRLASRKRWIAFGTQSKGKIIIDDGAKKALLYKDSSLLAPGISSLEGNFSSKDVVSIIDKGNVEIARGITHYSSTELSSLKGKKAEKEVVHRNDLVLLM